MFSVIPPEGIPFLLTNPDGAVYTMNQAAEELLGKRVKEFINQALSRRPEDSAVIDFNDRKIQVNILKSPFANCMVLFDMSQQEQFEQQAEWQRQEIEILRSDLQSEHELRAIKEHSTAMIAHEFGAPLSVIRSLSGLLKMHFDRLPQEKIVNFLDKIEFQVSHMVALLDDLTFVNMAHSGQGIFHSERLNLKAFCEPLLVEIARRYGAREVTLTCTGELNDVPLDRRLIRYMLSNLVGNALKYSPDGSEVRLDIRGSDQEVTFSVADHGIGIPADELDRVFDPFYRASNTVDFNGSGLGLAIVKNGIEACSGTIKVESELGKGTTIHVSLPRLKGANANGSANV